MKKLLLSAAIVMTTGLAFGVIKDADKKAQNILNELESENSQLEQNVEKKLQELCALMPHFKIQLEENAGGKIQELCKLMPQIEIQLKYIAGNRLQALCELMPHIKDNELATDAIHRYYQLSGAEYKGMIESIINYLKTEKTLTKEEKERIAHRLEYMQQSRSGDTHELIEQAEEMLKNK